MATRRITRKPPGRRRPVLRRLSILALAFALAPFVLIVVYAPPFVHPVSTLMLRDTALARGYERRWMPLDAIAPALVQSVLVAEDARFCAHGGVDWPALTGIVADAVQGARTRGASTIAMQTVKNLFLWPSRSYVRKGLEIPLALAAGAAWPKRRLMEIYLNIAEWAPGVYGIEAAARHHYGRPAARLTRRQAAMLAAILPNPASRDLARPSPGLRRLAGIVERRAALSGAYIACLDG